ncbi:Leu/Phe/Val dehydrogenase [Paenibacillus soyae]|uniref:Amino acid dehydrogenase n=1 Tax=Paenibacillus soyae TaxID=2969249 RepID=A0A9X2MQW5_9BACL|nr:amino acid dehydrogenase [Paenibacillus soyae]MCR2806608.1 amino acid dehydrogenase [Paenibacillus soyae]
MDIWKEHYEQLIFLQDRAIGFKAVIAVHHTKLGPALGGCRMMHYASEEEAVQDALRLARGMTYKSALAGIPYGGGKAVMLEQPGAAVHREVLFRTLGRQLQKLNGLYITGLDLGSTVQDMDFVRHETTYVTDTTGSLGAEGELTATMTAYGVFLGIQASLKRAYGSESPKNRVVAVQGLGKVGYKLCRYLNEAGAKLIVSDIDADRVRRAAAEFAAVPCAPDAIHSAPCDVFAPCALGGILNEHSIPMLDCAIVAGAANNQLASPEDGERLHRRGILFAPDYAINAGGIIVTAAELEGADAAKAKRDTERIYGSLERVFAEADSIGLSTAAAADKITEELLG